MLRTTFSRTAPRAVALLRPFSSTSVAFADGDTGATRTGGAVAGDAFTRREAASEEFYIKEEEKRKLLALKAKIDEQKGHLDKLQAEIDEMVTTGSKK